MFNTCNLIIGLFLFTNFLIKMGFQYIVKKYIAMYLMEMGNLMSYLIFNIRSLKYKNEKYRLFK